MTADSITADTMTIDAFDPIVYQLLVMPADTARRLWPRLPEAERGRLFVEFILPAERSKTTEQLAAVMAGLNRLVFADVWRALSRADQKLLIGGMLTAKAHPPCNWSADDMTAWHRSDSTRAGP